MGVALFLRLACSTIRRRICLLFQNEWKWRDLIISPWIMPLNVLICMGITGLLRFGVRLDHHHINDVIGKDTNPTAEYMAQWICQQVGPKCFKVEVQESEGNVAIYERD